MGMEGWGVEGCNYKLKLSLTYRIDTTMNIQYSITTLTKTTPSKSMQQSKTMQQTRTTANMNMLIHLLKA